MARHKKTLPRGVGWRDATTKTQSQCLYCQVPCQTIRPQETEINTAGSQMLAKAWSPPSLQQHSRQLMRSLKNTEQHGNNHAHLLKYSGWLSSSPSWKSKQTTQLMCAAYPQMHPLIEHSRMHHPICHEHNHHVHVHALLAIWTRSSMCPCTSGSRMTALLSWLSM